MNRTTKRNSWMLGLAAVGLLAVGVAAAEGRGSHGKACGRQSGPLGGMRAILSQLDLSAEQKTDIKEIVMGERPVLEPLADQAATARKDMFQAVHASTLDEGSIRAASDRLAKAQLALAIERARTVARVREILSPEQRQTLDAARDERLARVEERGRHARRMIRDRMDDSID